tara:strand:- start:206 stop:478 length:273 start_codon:yes stop_codon:yes gene_type:complete
MRIKLLSAQANAPASGAATNMSNATCVLAVNTAAVGTDHLITVTSKDEAAVLGTFTLLGKSEKILSKLPDEEIFAADGAVKLTKVAIQSA